MPDLTGLLALMNETQRRVFNDAMSSQDDLTEWQHSIRDRNRQATAVTLHNLLSRHGAGSMPVTLGTELSTVIDDAAQASAESILSTYNLALARAILTIGDVLPDADYDTYRSRLLGDSATAVAPGLLNWASQRGPEKIVQIAMTETATTIKLAIGLFYLNNLALDGLADLMPYYAGCEYCQEGIDGNSYASINDALDTGERIGMFHPRCIHYAELLAPRLAVDSSEVWAGGD